MILFLFKKGKMKINVILNVGKRPSGASRPIIEFCNALSLSNDIIIYKAYNPNRKGLEYSLREILGLFLKGKRFSQKWIECLCPIEIVPSYKEKYFRDADIVFFRSVHLAGEISKWENNKGKKVMRVSNVHLLSNPVEIPTNITLVASSTMVYEELKSLYPQHKIYRVGNGVNCNFFSYVERKNKEPRTIGMVFYGGADASHKGMDAGFEVMRSIKERFPEMRFIVAGIKKEKTIPDFVEFIKGLKSKDMLKFYRQTDILIYPSLEDAWPNPPMEAMSCGCCVVTTDVGGIRDFAIDKKTALICSPGNVNEMVNSVEILIRNPEYWRSLISNAVERIKKFDYSKQAKNLEEVFYEILSTP